MRKPAEIVAIPSIHPATTAAAWFATAVITGRGLRSHASNGDWSWTAGQVASTSKEPPQELPCGLRSWSVAQ